MNETIEEPSTEDELIDAQKHCGRLEHELAMLKAGLGVGLRWSTTPPLMSGVYLNADRCEFEPSKIIDAAHWQVVDVLENGAMMFRHECGEQLGPYWAGPITVEGP